jgi:hypothetical protein
MNVLTLNDEQKRSLERNIECLLNEQGSGHYCFVEVKWVEERNDGRYRIHYGFETDTQGSSATYFFRMDIYPDSIENLEIQISCD